MERGQGDSMNRFEQITPDRPLEDPSQDLLGYASFSRSLADGVSRAPEGEGLVVAVYGQWGLGKTTVLNFIEHYLTKDQAHSGPIVTRFNPWWFSGSDDLVRQFFDQFGLILGVKLAQGRRLRRNLAQFAEAVSHLPGVSSAKAISKILEPDDVGLHDVKQRLDKALLDVDQRIVVMIDDLDRLTPTELLEVVRLTKAVADFRSVIYILAMDRDVAAKALQAELNVSGDEYLEKIVQVPFDLPLPDRSALQRMLTSTLDVVVTPSEATFSEARWGNVFHKGLDRFLATPRDVVRLLNALAVSYSAVEGEVNVVDFIGIESLRLFAPEAYEVIRRNEAQFSGAVSDRDDRDELTRFHETWMARIDEPLREPVRELLLELFPKTALVWGNTRFGTDHLAAWRRDLRVCSPDRFSVYFRLSVPTGGLTTDELNTLLAHTSDPNGLGAELIRLVNETRPDGISRVREALELLGDHLQQIPFGSYKAIIRALLDVGDQLQPTSDDKPAFFWIDSQLLIDQLLFGLLKRMEQEDRVGVLTEAIQAGKAVGTSVAFVSILGQEHGKYAGEDARPEPDPLVALEQQEALEQVALMKIREAAADGTLINSPSLTRTLYRWRDWAGEGEPQAWVSTVIQDNARLAKLFEAFLQVRVVAALGNATAQQIPRLRPDSLEPFADTDLLATRAKTLLAQDSLTETQQTAVEQFLKEFRGEVPDRD